jgi:TatD DNase family protein
MKNNTVSFLTDTHAHIHFSPLAEDIPSVLQRAAANGVRRIINIGTNLNDSVKAVKAAEANAGVYAAVGIHPHDASSFSRRDIPKFEELLSSPKVIAVGEVGLDFYRNLSEPKAQEEVFAIMLDIALSHRLPVVIHSREAAADTARILKYLDEDKSLPIILHCFDGSDELLEFGLKRGNVFFSFAGNLTYKKAEKIAAALLRLDTDKVLIETDSPYLAPNPLRGKDNEPSFIVHTARFAAKNKNMEYDELAEILEKNFSGIFGSLGIIS